MRAISTCVPLRRRAGRSWSVSIEGRKEGRSVVEFVMAVESWLWNRRERVMRDRSFRSSLLYRCKSWTRPLDPGLARLRGDFGSKRVRLRTPRRAAPHDQDGGRLRSAFADVLVVSRDFRRPYRFTSFPSRMRRWMMGRKGTERTMNGFLHGIRHVLPIQVFGHFAADQGRRSTCFPS
jgi:hypothetical protein